MTVAIYAPFIALAGALINGLLGKRLKEPLPGLIAVGAMLLSFILVLLNFFSFLGKADESLRVKLWSFLSAGSLKVDVAFQLDSLSLLMMLIITGVGLLIHIYSMSYMPGDDGYSRYFMALNLFVAAMLVLVLADSYPLMFVGWEGVGVCSYLLIGFWYKEKLNADAARKAFIVNRIGDVGFILAMALMVKLFGSLNIAEVTGAVQNVLSNVGGAGIYLTILALLLMLAASGKSAQLPLHVWLPDAMAGPTPVSALIHAATMVTAGVYLIARSSEIFVATPLASAFVAWIGALTALIAAFSAMSQKDIKKILAYSTISQLGYMFAAVGAGAYWVGIFHVFTHAFFKALLFLASGSVIHALHGEQNIDRMGGLKKYLPTTAQMSFIATLAIAGMPLLSGFFSKDAILSHVFNSQLIAGYGSGAIYAILLLTAGMTAFYMYRWYHCVFAGEERLSAEAKAHVHESPALMTGSYYLGLFSIFAGYLGLPEAFCA
ncbi:MAG: NADH-quinone oxidoreductase subunit L [Deinococcales bacterium]